MLDSASSMITLQVTSTSYEITYTKHIVLKDGLDKLSQLQFQVYLINQEGLSLVKEISPLQRDESIFKFPLREIPKFNIRQCFK